MGLRYREGDQMQPNCTTRCICQNGKFVCHSQSCIADGATCYAWGDPHYRTFDLKKFDFQGDCEYVLTQSCNSSEFSVIVTNSAHNQYVSCTDSVRVVVPNSSLNILLGRGNGGTVTINDRLQPNNGDEMILQSDQVEVTRVGGQLHVILSTSGVRISWDGFYYVAVTVSTSWRGRLCGLCGNYNGNPNDDFITSNNILTTSADIFGHSWVVNNNLRESCGGLITPNPCPSNVMTEAQTRCGVLREIYFSTCNDAVDPTDFIESCVYDYCHCNEIDREGCYCNSLAAYARVCSGNGVVLQEWREYYCSKQLNYANNIHGSGSSYKCIYIEYGIIYYACCL